MCSPDIHKNDVCTIDRTEKNISFSFSLLLKYMLTQLFYGNYWTTGNQNFLKGEPIFSQDRNHTLQTGKKVFCSPSSTHWDNTRLVNFLFSILSHVLPPFTWVLFLKSHTDVCLFYFWMLFLHPLGALSPIPKLTSASVTTSGFSCCGWDLPDSPVVLVSHIQDAI